MVKVIVLALWELHPVDIENLLDESVVANFIPLGEDVGEKEFQPSAYTSECEGSSNTGVDQDLDTPVYSESPRFLSLI